MSFTIQYRCQLVRPDFRAWIKERLNLQADEEWRFIHYALLGVPDEEGALPVPRQVVAEMEGVTDPYFIKHRYVGHHFLERMQQRFPELQIQWHDFDAGVKTRQLVVFIPSDIEEAIKTELAYPRPPESERVFFVDGSKIDRHKKKAIRETQLIEIQTINKALSKPMTADQALILTYMNGLPSNLFTKLSKHLDKAFDAASQLPEASAQREQGILEAISLHPQQFYKRSPNSLRLAPFNTGICSLKSEIRHVLTVDWIEVDLKSVQFAINAKVWNIPEVITFLESGQSWWAELFAWLNLEPTDDFKRVLKDRTYALCYGMSNKNLMLGTDLTAPEDAKALWPQYASRFMAHPIVIAIQKARTHMFNQIEQQGGYSDAYGNWIQLEISGLTLKKQRKKRHKEVTELSVLSLVSQSYEQALIAEIFKLANTTDEFKVMLYQYDGVSLHIKDKARTLLWLNRIKQAVQDKADELGIQTALEVSK